MLKGNNNLKGFSISFGVHAAILAVILYTSSQESVANAVQEKFVTISLSSFELPKPQEAVQPKVQPKPKKVEPKPEVKKEVPKPCPKPKKEKAQEVVQEQIAEPEVIEEVQETQQEVVQEEIVEPIEAIETAALEPTEVTPMPSAATLEEEFVKTNFEIIRDMVLANLKYPNMAKRMGQTGIVELILVIDTSGKLLEVILQKSSGYKLLDKSALQAATRLSEAILPNPQAVSRVVLPVAFA
ncbi:MAG: TonB family protein, partial [Thiovulaceae bacterium]|nr:TonB family protein [Sulfurimonadaceae bacterium]